MIPGAKDALNFVDPLAHQSFCDIYGNTIFGHQIRLHIHDFMESRKRPSHGMVRDKKIIKERKERLFELFPMLKDKRHARSGSLSGGQQQMLAIARGLMTDPKVLLLDEPSLGLSPKVVKEVFELVRKINEERRTAIMVVEHNIRSLLSIAHRAYVLDKGRVIEKDKTPAELSKEGELARIALGAH